MSDAACVTGPCSYWIVRLDDGTTRPFDPAAQNARLAEAAGGSTIVLTDTGGMGGAAGTTVHAHDLPAGDRRVLFTDSDGVGLGLAREGQAAWAPPGWVVLAPASGTAVGPSRAQ